MLIVLGRLKQRKRQVKQMEEIETKRLRLREWTLEDAKALYAYASNPDVGPQAGWKPHESEGESLRIIQRLFIPNGVWAICLKENGKVIGSIGLEPDKRRPGISSRELGYSLGEEYWGKGFMTEAAKAVLEYCFMVLNLEIVAICTSPKNIKSQRVIEKCGFSYEGTQRKTYRIYTGAIRDTKCYSMLKEEWQWQNGIPPWTA